MENWPTAFKRALVSGTSASLLSTLALGAFGQRAAGSAYAPTNAVSHWLWGERAARRNAPSLRYTLTGYLIHHASATFWAVLLERLVGDRLDRASPAATVAVTTAASAIAAFTDYELTPRRLRPGYEKRLSRPALTGVYAMFGLGLAAGVLLSRRER